MQPHGFGNDENLNEAVSHEGPLYIIYTVFKKQRNHDVWLYRKRRFRAGKI